MTEHVGGKPSSRQSVPCHPPHPPLATFGRTHDHLHRRAKEQGARDAAATAILPCLSSAPCKGTCRDPSTTCPSCLLLASHMLPNQAPGLCCGNSTLGFTDDRQNKPPHRCSPHDEFSNRASYGNSRTNKCPSAPSTPMHHPSS